MRISAVPSHVMGVLVRVHVGSMKLELALVLLALVLGCHFTEAFATTVIPVDPRSTFLRGDAWGSGDGRYDLPEPPLILDLSSLEFSPGDNIVLTQHGDRTSRYGAGDVTNLNGVFSTSDVLLDHHQRYRVPGALEAGVDFVTGAILDGNPSDIAEDFRIDPSVTMSIPNGAEYLFVGTVDSFYWDNRDPDNDFAVSIVPEPPTIVLLLSVLLGMHFLRITLR